MELQPMSTARIDFQDCDPFGHLNNTKYLNYMMNARTEHLRDFYGFDVYEHTEKTGNAWLVTKSRIAYYLPVTFNKKVLLETQLIYADQRRAMPQCIMYSEDKSLMHAILWVEFIYVDTRTGKPKKHEADLQNLLDQITVNKNKKIDELNFDETVKTISSNFRKSRNDNK